MSQLDLFERTTSAPAAPGPNLATWWRGLDRWRRPFRTRIGVASRDHDGVPVPAVVRTHGWYAAPVSISRALWAHDEFSQAGYVVTAPNPALPHLTCGIEASVVPCLASKTRTWLVAMHIELPGHGKRTWSVVRTFDTREVAARELADLVAYAEALLDRALHGEPVETPGQRRQRAAEAHADVDQAYQEAVGRAEAEQAAYEALGESDPERWSTRARWSAAKQVAARLRQKSIDAFHAAHTWREFA